MSREIDPKKAVTDLDAVTLDQWTVTQRSDSLIVVLDFVGGLGRTTDPTGLPLYIDEAEAVHVERKLVLSSQEQQDALTSVLSRWQKTGLPLRVLEFLDEFLIVEDKETFLKLPGPNM